ncbi:MAG: DinB family protein [Eudoraea sp.]|nr:DinB family protein [Eudoraea sp.]
MGLTQAEYLWRPGPDKWCLLELICHLYDEEREDFRARTKHTLETPAKQMPPIDPLGWVVERKYKQQDFADKLTAFLEEREHSVAWLQSLQSPKWDNAYDHPEFGQMTAKMFLSNWLVHDYIHIRQILKVKFGYLQQLSNENLTYAGNW